MSMEGKVATIFGGTGFVGRQIVRELAKKGVVIKVATRVPERAYFLRPCGTVGQIVPVFCDYNDPASIAASLRGSDFAVNCIGILFQKGKKRTFKKAHVDTAEMIAKACAAENVQRFVQISALGIEGSKSRYAQTKLAGEKAVLAAFPKATILRPSVIFGQDDDFFNRFARMAGLLPALPLIGGGYTRFQPVFVGDVADAALAAITLPALGEGNPQGRIYELGGPEVLNFRQIYQLMFSYTRQKRCLIRLPYGMAKIQAGFFSLLPTPPLTGDQVESLKTDSVVTGKYPKLADLGIQATALESVLPSYLPSYRPGGRFAGQKAA